MSHAPHDDARFTVLVPDAVDASALSVLRAEPRLDVIAPGGMARADTLAAIAGAHALIIRSSTTADAPLLEAAPHLRVVARAGVGVDNVDVPAATARGIAVMNTPSGNSIATAEHTFALMLALVRHIPQAHVSLGSGTWDRKAFMGSELRGKTLGIVGFGRIGREVAARAVAFGMKVIEYDPFVPTEMAQALGFEAVDMPTLLARADIITLHTVLNDATANLINADALAHTKRGVRVINAARGGLVDAHALAEAILAGHVAGAAIDVFEPEPPAPDNPLIGLPGVIHTPHLAASTREAQVAVGVEAAQLVADALLRGTLSNVVNAEVLTRAPWAS